MHYYVHLVPQTTSLVQETVKLSVSEEGTVNDLRLAILEHLNKHNDGNKEYAVRALATADHPDAQPLPLGALLGSFVEPAGDLFCHLTVQVDARKHVKPVEVRPASKAPEAIVGDDKFVTVQKYSYYESGSKWVKVQLEFFKGLKDHPADKLITEFKQRSLTIKVLDYKGANYQFQVPRLQCKVLPEQCSVTAKPDCLTINLRKFKDDDNWWSLFKTKAIGEVDSD